MTKLPSDSRYFNLSFPLPPTNVQCQVLEQGFMALGLHLVPGSQESGPFGRIILEAISALKNGSQYLTKPGRDYEPHTSVRLNQK